MDEKQEYNRHWKNKGKGRTLEINIRKKPKRTKKKSVRNRLNQLKSGNEGKERRKKERRMGNERLKFASLGKLFLQ